ncbi:MAG: DUF2059 domain-containing protein [Alphaproteobacteria bacterium]
MRKAARQHRDRKVRDRGEMKTWIASLGLVAFCFTPAFAQDAASAPDPKIELATKIIQEIHTADNLVKILDSMVPQMVKSLKQEAPNLTDGQLKMISDMLLDEMKARIPIMIAANARIYAKHFTLDEMKAMEQFYQSPAGQKAIDELPAIAQETFPLGMAWGQESAKEALPKVIEKLRSQGVKI